MNIKRKSEYIGALGALLVHVAIIALLILVSFAIPHPDEEAGGVPVMMGDVDAAYGNYDPSTMVDVEVLPEEVPAPQPEPEVETEQEMITQTEEETVVVKPKAEPKKEKPKVAKKPEKTPEEKLPKLKSLPRKRRNVNVRLQRKLPVNEWPVLLVKVRKWGEVKVRLLQEKESKEVKTVILRPEQNPESEGMEHLILEDVL